MSGARTLFLAVELSAALRRDLAPLLGQLAGLDSTVRPAAAEGLHLTLRYLGPVEPEAEASARRVAGEVARVTAPFPVELREVGVFGQRQQPRVVWAGVGTGAVELGRLAQALAAGLVAEGWAPERRKFRAHCTLARLPEPLGASARAVLEEICSPTGPPLRLGMQAAELALLESVAVPGGPNRYPRAASWTFRGR